MGHVLRPFFQHRRTAPCEPDLLIDETTNLEPFGVPGQIVSTPGHTPGSISLLLPSGDLLAGDLLLGGYLGGHVAPAQPGLPYFLDDREQMRDSIRRILRLPLTRVYVGHGGPLEPEDVRRARAALDTGCAAGEASCTPTKSGPLGCSSRAPCGQCPGPRRAGPAAGRCL